MLNDIRMCEYKECGKIFTAKTHNQKYHTDECCRLATNARIMEKYYERKARLKGTVRVCKSIDCETKLSRYNPSTICASCERKDQERDRHSLLEMLQ